jgi:LPS export ABC transporter permease LptF
MKLLDRYIFREILFPSVIGLLALTFVFLSHDIGRLFEVIVRQSATPSELWHITVAALPNVLTFTIPMAVLVGILTGFGRMSSDSEAIAFRAAGVSMVRILRPVMMLAVIAWLITFSLSVWIAPRTAAHLRDFLHTAMAMKQVSFELKPRVFNEELANRVLYVQDSDGRSWHGILLADMTNPAEPLVTFALSGTLVPDEKSGNLQLTLSNGDSHVVSPADPGRYTLSHFDMTKIPIPMPPAPAIPSQPPASQTDTGFLWSRMKAGQASYEEQVEFHRRLALPFACLSLALVALPLGVSTTRGSKSMGMVFSLILMLVYYLVFIGGTRVAANAQFSPMIGAWLANAGFAVLGGFLLVRSDRERENRVLNRVAESLSWFANRVSSLKPSRRAFSQWAYSLTHHPKFFRVLDIYVLRGFWFFFTLVLVVFVSLFVIVTLFELLPDIVKNNINTGIVANYFLYLLPQIVYWVLPLTVLLAILINLGTLTKTNEILAVKAGAISLYRMAIPLLLMGLLLSSGMYLLQDFLLPYTNQKQDEYRNIIKDRAPQTYRDPNRKWMAGSGNRIYHYNYFEPDSNLFGRISIFTFQPNTLELKEWLFAERASWQRTSWNFESGWIRRFGAQGELPTYESFDRLSPPGVDTPESFK